MKASPLSLPFFYPKGLIIISFYTFGTFIFFIFSSPQEVCPEILISVTYTLYFNVHINLDIDIPKGI